MLPEEPAGGQVVALKAFTIEQDPRVRERRDSIVPFLQDQPDELFSAFGLDNDKGKKPSVIPIKPPVSFDALAEVYGSSAILPQCGAAVEAAVEGQGIEIVPRQEQKDDPESKERMAKRLTPEIEKEMRREKRRLRRFFANASRPMTWIKMLKQTRRDKEPFGWRTMQVIRLPPEGWNASESERKRMRLASSVATVTGLETSKVKAIADGYLAGKDGFARALKAASIDDEAALVRQALEDPGAFVDPLGEIVCVQHMPSHTMRYCYASDPILVKEWLYEEDEPEDEEDNPATPGYLSQLRWARFRLMLHSRQPGYSSIAGIRTANATGGTPVYFREFGDPRIVDSRTGEVIGNYLEGDFPTAKGEDGKLKHPPQFWANEIIVDREYFPTFEPYGRPWWHGVAATDMAITGGADANLFGITNPNIPRLIILSEGTNTTQADLDMIGEKLSKKRNSPGDQFKVVMIQTEPRIIGDEMGATGAKGIRPALQVVPVTSIPDDGLFVEFDQQGRDKVRSARRLSSMSIGLSQDMNFASANASITVEDQSVMQPERDDFDSLINNTIVASLRAKWFRYKSKGRKIVDPEVRSKAVEVAHAGGALTPNQHLVLLSDTLGVEMPLFDEPWANMPIAIVLEELKAALAPAPAPMPGDVGPKDDGQDAKENAEDAETDVEAKERSAAKSKARKLASVDQLAHALKYLRRSLLVAQGSQDGLR